MSISWAKLCADAEAKSLQELLNGNYVMGGILVRFEFLCLAKVYVRAWVAHFQSAYCIRVFFFEPMLRFRSLALLGAQSHKASPSRAGANGAQRRRPKVGGCMDGLPPCAVLEALQAPSHLQLELLLSPSAFPDKELSRL